MALFSLENKMKNEELTQILQEGEGQFVEFKEKVARWR